MASARFREGTKPWKCFRFIVAILLLSIGREKVVDAQEAATTVATNPSDLQALHELMTSLNSDEDWLTLTPDPCVSGPQGIFCEPDPLTGVLFVTTLQFGFLSAIANIIPCSPNATIPSSIANFTKLTTLSFTSCFTNKEKLTPFPPSLPVTLRLLTFTSNPALTGPIPPTLGSLQNLQRLVLSQNGLQGEIPSELGGLRALVQLDLSHNELSGSIPESLGAIEGLVNLDLRWNKLQGVVPVAMSQGLNQLQRLALSNNRIESIMLPPHSSLQALTFLDLSWNELSGELPAAIGSLSRLEDLFLNSNRRLNGTIPSSIGKLASLVRLDLSNCGLEGAIPEEVGGLQNLRFFSVSRNKLSGGIPESLASLPVIFTMNLEGNQLSGAVPFSASFMQKMGPRNLVMKPENAGLCSHVETPQQRGLLGLEPCPENGTGAAGSAARAPTSPSPNGGNPLRASTTAGPSAFIVSSVLALMNCWFWMIV